MNINYPPGIGTRFSSFESLYTTRTSKLTATSIPKGELIQVLTRHDVAYLWWSCKKRCFNVIWTYVYYCSEFWVALYTSYPKNNSGVVLYIKYSYTWVKTVYTVIYKVQHCLAQWYKYKILVMIEPIVLSVIHRQDEGDTVFPRITFSLS